MSAVRRVLLASMLGTLGACQTSIEVLSPARQLDGASDAALEPSDAGEPLTPDTGTPVDPCGGCAAEELCAVDRCVPAADVQWIDTHFNHTCAVRRGRAFCWGGNTHGQLGVGDRAMRLAPARIGTNNDWLMITTGERHTCGVRAPGALYCWGQNDAAQLGTGDTEPRMTPAPVMSDRAWRSVACGGDSCCAIDASDELYCWGDNSEGKLGQLDGGGAPDVVAPQLVDDTRWRRVDVGQGHVCAIREPGTLHCWGRNTDVALGVGPLPEQLRGTTRVGDASDWIDISCSQHSSCGVRANGALFCWGVNSAFEVGSPTLQERVDRPRRVGAASDWAAVGAGWFHSCALKRSGALFCWGRAIEGQLGQGGGDPVEPPTEITTATFARFALGNFHTCGATAEGALQCWGANDRGQLGTGDIERRHEPVVIP